MGGKISIDDIVQQIERLRSGQAEKLVVGGFETDNERILDMIYQTCKESTPQELKAYVALVERAIEDDTETARNEPQAKDIHHLTEVMLTHTPPFLHQLIESESQDDYFNLIHIAESRFQRRKTAESVLPYLKQLAKPKYRKAYTDFMERSFSICGENLGSIVGFSSGLDPLSSLDVITKRKYRDVFFDILECLNKFSSREDISHIYESIPAILDEEDKFRRIIRQCPKGVAVHLLAQPSSVEGLDADRIIRTISELNNRLGPEIYRHVDSINGKYIARIIKPLLHEGEVDRFIRIVGKLARFEGLQRHFIPIRRAVLLFEKFNREEDEDYYFNLLDWSKAVNGIDYMTFFYCAARHLQEFRENETVLLPFIEKVFSMFSDLEQEDYLLPNEMIKYFPQYIPQLADEAIADGYLRLLGRLIRLESDPHKKLAGHLACFSCNSLEYLRDPANIDNLIDVCERASRFSDRSSEDISMMDFNVIHYAPLYVESMRLEERKERLFEIVFDEETPFSERKRAELLMFTPPLCDEFSNPEDLDLYKTALPYLDINEATLGKLSLKNFLIRFERLKDVKDIELLAKISQRMSRHYIFIHDEIFLDDLIDSLPVMRQEDVLDRYIDFVRLIASIKNSSGLRHSRSVGGCAESVVPYFSNLDREALDTCLDLITENLSSAPENPRSWLQTGLKFAKRKPEYLEKYFSYRPKGHAGQSKINEVAAFDMLIERDDEPESLLEIHKVRYVKSADATFTAVKDTFEILELLYRIDYAADSKENKDSILQELAAEHTDLKETIYALGSNERALFKTLKQDSVLLKISKELKKAKNKRARMKALLDPVLAKHVLRELRDLEYMQGAELEQFRDYITDNIVRLDSIEDFTELRIEKNRFVLDDLIDRSACCISGEGSDREVSLIYALDKDELGRENTIILALNAYGDSTHVTIGKAIMVDVDDTESGKKMLLVDGVLVGPDISYLLSEEAASDADLETLLESRGESKFITQKGGGFNWKRMFLSAIFKYAHENGYDSILVNSEHSRAQQCTHDFPKYVADVMNHTIRLCEQGILQQEKRHDVRYTYTPNSSSIIEFTLGTRQIKHEGADYTHHIKKRPMDPETARKIYPKDEYNHPVKGADPSKIYLHSTYRDKGAPWTDCIGYIKAIEIPLDRECEVFVDTSITHTSAR